MKLEKREIVITKDVFIAVDGKEFNTEDACLEHEYDINESKLAFYDRNFKKSTLDACTYVRLDTEKDVKLMLSLCDYQGITDIGIANPGVYIYVDRGDYWVNMSEAVRHICGGFENAEN